MSPCHLQQHKTYDCLRLKRLALLSASAFLALAAPLSARENASHPAAKNLSPDERAAQVVSQMTLDEKIALLHGHYPNKMEKRPDGVPMSAGWVAGLPRLGIPAQRMTDAGLGVAAAHQPSNQATAMPSGLALAATWNAALAETGGQLIGSQARKKGFNVMLAGGVNLVREPRNGRNFEYLGEDPLLAGTLVGHAIKGIQSNNIVATIKHYALNAQETGRLVLNARIDESALRESDLLAFQIGIEIGDPGSTMCAYNRLNGDYACENAMLFDILKKEWKWPGWIMSDWGGVHSTVKAVNAGLDQESGQELDTYVYYDQMLKDALASGAVQQSQVDGMVMRLMRSLYAKGVMDNPVAPGVAIDPAEGLPIARDAATRGIVLLKNSENILPLTGKAKRIAVIGGRADQGVLSGAGSSQVIPDGSLKVDSPEGVPVFAKETYYHPSSPLRAIRDQAGTAKVDYADGTDLKAAVALASQADVVILFGTQWSTEGMDMQLKLDGEQDRLIQNVAAANPNTIVVLETGGPVLMPWLNSVGAVVEAWFPGAAGGPAIADILFGKAIPSGRLPVTFPASLDQLPNPVLPGSKLPRPGKPANIQPEPFDVDYPEGADVGYRWFDRKGHKPLFPFGFGLSYTTFQHTGLSFDPNQLTARFTVSNTGKRAGLDTPQLYVRSPDGRRSLVGWGSVQLAPGKSKAIKLSVDPRLLARFDVAQKSWVIAPGQYKLILANNAADSGVEIDVSLPAQNLPAQWSAKGQGWHRDF